MQYKIKVWRTVGARQVEITEDRRPACPGNFLKSKGCTARPAHVITWPGRPGYGRVEVHYACYRHLHGLIKHGEAVASHVTVTAYEGV